MTFEKKVLQLVSTSSSSEHTRPIRLNHVMWAALARCQKNGLKGWRRLLRRLVRACLDTTLSTNIWQSERRLSLRTVSLELFGRLASLHSIQISLEMKILPLVVFHQFMNTCHLHIQHSLHP